MQSKPGGFAPHRAALGAPLGAERSYDYHTLNPRLCRQGPPDLYGRRSIIARQGHHDRAPCRARATCHPLDG